MSVKWRFVGALAAVAALVVTGVTTAGTSHRAASTLKIMGFGTNGDDVATTRFNIAKKAVAPDSVSAPNGGFDDQQFLAAVASHQVPDLVYWDRAKVGTYAAKG